MAEQAHFNRFPDFFRDPQAKKEERTRYVKALADTHIGSIERGGTGEKLASFQRLCQDLSVSPTPASVTQCKKVCHECSDGLACFLNADRLGQELKKVNVCIIDLIDSRRLGTQVDCFSNSRELQEHIRTTKHYFPKDEAKGNADGLMKVLLRKIDGRRV